MARQLYQLGDHPPVGEVPARMLAQVIRQERFGEPRDAFALEEVDVPSLGPRDVLVYVMAAGVNYNNVWAALGVPINVIKARLRRGETEDFHIGGSDASGVVWKVGAEVTSVAVGDEVVVHCGSWQHDDPHVVAGKDPMLASSQKIWGYETNWGSFAQYCRVQDHQCLKKPPRLSWEAAAAYMLVGATAYRMLHGFAGNVVDADDPVLIWGGAGGLGSMAIQIVKAAGGRPVAVVGSDDKIDYCKKLGAVGVINRKKFHHWGMLPHWKDDVGYGEWLTQAKAFGRQFWEALGAKRKPSHCL